MLIDSKREKDIFLGTSYPFETLAEGACLINSYQRSALGLEIGSQLSLTMGSSLNSTLTVVIENYNNIAL